MNNIGIYKQIFKDVFNVNDSDLNSHFNYNEVGNWDSLTHLTLISELENAFDIMFETEDILHYGGFCNGMKILEKYGIDFNE